MTQKYQIQINSVETGKWKPIVWMYQPKPEDNLDVCVQKTKGIIAKYGHLSPIRLFNTETNEAATL